MAAPRHLVCPSSCPGGRFELLGGRVVVDSTGACLQHDDRVASFRCLLCGAVAFDLAAAEKLLRRQAPTEAEEELTCPSCGSVLLAPPGVDAAVEVQCPDCGAVFSPDEGRERLLGAHSRDEEEAGPDSA